VKPDYYWCSNCGQFNHEGVACDGIHGAPSEIECNRILDGLFAKIYAGEAQDAAREAQKLAKQSKP